MQFAVLDPGRGSINGMLSKNFSELKTLSGSGTVLEFSWIPVQKCARVYVL